MINWHRMFMTWLFINKLFRVLFDAFSASLVNNRIWFLLIRNDFCSLVVFISRVFTSRGWKIDFDFSSLMDGKHRRTCRNASIASFEERTKIYCLAIRLSCFFSFIQPRSKFKSLEKLISRLLICVLVIYISSQVIKLWLIALCICFLIIWLQHRKNSKSATNDAMLVWKQVLYVVCCCK